MDIKTKMLGDDLSKRLQVAVLLVRTQEKEKDEIRKDYENKIKHMELKIQALEKIRDRHKPKSYQYCDRCNKFRADDHCDLCDKFICKDCNGKDLPTCSICSQVVCSFCNTLEGGYGYVCKFMCWSEETEDVHWYCEGCYGSVPKCIKCQEDMIVYKY